MLDAGSEPFVCRNPTKCTSLKRGAHLIYRCGGAYKPDRLKKKGKMRPAPFKLATLLTLLLLPAAAARSSPFCPPESGRLVHASVCLPANYSRMDNPQDLVNVSVR